MESVDLNMDDLFENEAMDDDIGAVSALPDLPDYREDEREGDEQDNEDAENVEVLAKLKDLSKGAAKKVVRKPQPKLDAARLTGERGIPILPNVFEKVKFKGKGHEVQDLALLMRNLEHWAHRLFPKMPFDEVIERAERLGAKREVQTCVKKIRLDMPILNDDFVGSDKEDDVMRQGDDLLPQGRTVQDMEDEWEDMMREAEESQADQTPLRASHTTPGSPRVTPGPSHDTPGPSQNTSHLSYDTPGPADSQLSTPAPQKSRTDSPFTPEQLERMERNKQMAREKRLGKMGIKSPAITSAKPLPSGSQQLQSSSSSEENQNKRIISPEKQTSSQTTDYSRSPRMRSQSFGKDTDLEATNTVSKDLDLEDELMSEVIRTQNDRVVATKQPDAQHWCTEPSVSDQSETNREDTTFTETSTLNTEEKIDEKDSSDMKDLEDEAADLKINRNGKLLEADESSEMESKEAEISMNDKSQRNSSAENENLNSEEMSEIVPNQTTGKVILSNHISETSGITESMGEMSEIIEKQDYKMPSLESDKENMPVLMNGFGKTDKSNAEILEEGKHMENQVKGCNNILNGGINDAADNKRIENGTDELNEDELMDTLES